MDRLRYYCLCLIPILVLILRSQARPLNTNMEGKKNQSLPVVVVVQDRYVSKRSEIPRSNDISNKHEMSGGDQSVHHGEVVSLVKGPVPPSVPSPCHPDIGNHKYEMSDGQCHSPSP